jgi:hypothetical protein
LGGLSLATPGRIDSDKIAAGRFEKHFRRAGAPAAVPDRARSIMHDRRSAVPGPRVRRVRRDHAAYEI